MIAPDGPPFGDPMKSLATELDLLAQEARKQKHLEQFCASWKKYKRNLRKRNVQKRLRR